MELQFWGVRGSIAVPGPTTIRYGGNTTCLEVRGDDGECLVFDAGTGIRVLGGNLMKRGMPLPPIHLFLSHTHWDHIQGFPFFVPIFIPGTSITAYGPEHYDERKSFKFALDEQMTYEFFPVSVRQLAADLRYRPLGETEFDIGSVHIQTMFTNHPVRSLGYRMTCNGRCVVFTGDNEPYHNIFETSEEEKDEDDTLAELFGGVDETVEDANARMEDFVRGANLLVTDCQYTPEEYESSRKNWGHSPWDYCLRLMQGAGVERMALTHHEPTRCDDDLDAMLADVRTAAAERGLVPESVMLAQEGLILEI